MSGVHRASTSRRGLLLGSAAGLLTVLSPVLAGCEAEPRAQRSRAAGPVTPDPTSSLTPDVALATTALAEIRAVREAVTLTRRRFPALGRALGDVTAMHVTHEGALADAVPDRAATDAPPVAYVVPRGRGPALAALLRREEALRDRLGELAIGAESGAFARLLGAMSAGLAQRVATWPT